MLLVSFGFDMQIITTEKRFASSQSFLLLCVKKRPNLWPI